MASTLDMHSSSDVEAWPVLDVQDLWVYDKLILAKYLGYVAGPAGVDLPCPGEYIVRPITNLYGMGLGASIQSFPSVDTSHLPPGTFWCEIFQGRHLSIDVVDGNVKLIYQGYSEGPNRFFRWKKLNEVINPPPFITKLSEKYGVVNYESIGDKIIEVHMRSNPDWIKHRADELIPIWKGTTAKIVPDPDEDRVGFVVIKRDE